MCSRESVSCGVGQIGIICQFACLSGHRDVNRLVCLLVKIERAIGNRRTVFLNSDFAVADTVI